MPIIKIPIIHKFGIISYNERVELQERLLKQFCLAERGRDRKKAIIAKYPLEVTDEFVAEYNKSRDGEIEEREINEGVARKMIERGKRRAGISVGGEGSHVDIPLAWTELGQLAQCKAPIQEESLDVLISSLDQAPFDQSQMSALFFLAEITLYSLRMETIDQPFLCTGELKLLRMGKLVFTRLFYHYMAGQLHDMDQFKNRLFTYLDGVSQFQDAYAPYPNALLSLRYIIEVGNIVLRDSNPNTSATGDLEDFISSDGSTGMSTTQNTTTIPTTTIPSTSKATGTFACTASTTVSNSVHDLSPTLWHALDVWRCVKNKGIGITQACQGLSSCGVSLALESWVDGIAAILILADAAKNHIAALKALQELACGIKFSKTGTRLSRKTTSSKYACKHRQHSEEAEIDYSNVTSGASIAIKQSNLSVVQSAASEESEDSVQIQSTTLPDIMPNTAWEAEVGTDLPSGRASEASSVASYGNDVFPEISGMNGWHWEVAITYAFALADICLHGATSSIQKVALVGKNTDVTVVNKVASISSCPLKSAGLLDLAFFKAKPPNGADTWSWRVRYSAFQGLVKLCRCTVKDPNKDGMQSVAWNTLLKAQSMERDLRVLEALKVGLVDANIDNMASNLQQTEVIAPATIGEKIGSSLSQLYLPPLPKHSMETAKRSRPWQKSKVKVGQSFPTPRHPLRTTLGQEILLATATYEEPASFEMRASYDLNRVIEDQWRKELQQTLDEDEAERLRELKRKQQAEEEDEDLVQKLRTVKLNKNCMSEQVSENQTGEKEVSVL